VKYEHSRDKHACKCVHTLTVISTRIHTCELPSWYKLGSTLLGIEESQQENL